MRLAIILGAFLMLIGARATASQPNPPPTGASVDRKWGVLAEMVERDFASIYRGQEDAVTFRWEVPGQSIAMSFWRSDSTVIRYTLEPTTNHLFITHPGRKPIRVVPQSDGKILFKERQGFFSVPNLWWDHGRKAYRYAPAPGAVFDLVPADGKPQAQAMIASLIASGKVRAAGGQSVLATNTQPVVASPNTAPSASVAPAIAAGAAADGPRYALIIGNSQYGASLGRLPNPVNDAQNVASALRAVGFTVDLVTDADQKAMKRSISRFGERLSSARGATGLFYYAGHGIQSRGTNFLIPVAAPIEREADLDLEAVAADTVLAQMEDAGAATSIVILDACRNMPLARSFRSASRGLARMDAPNGSFVAYSTAPGAVAADGDGRNSPFAAALIKQISQKGMPIEVMFRGIRREVVAATGGQQTPWDSSSLLEPFYFAQ